jgi:hypothetical protein
MAIEDDDLFKSERKYLPMSAASSTACTYCSHDVTQLCMFIHILLQQGSEA